VIYVAGYGRSGSTVLDTLLGNHPAVFGAGELTRLFDEWSSDRSCSCGQGYEDCPFWQEVIGRVRVAFPALSLAQGGQVTRAVESLPVPLSVGASRSQRALYRDLWRAILSAIGEVSDKNIVVDSSKSARTCTWRIQRLAQIAELDISAIHLVRDPRAVMASILRGSNRKLEQGQPAALPGGAYRALASWCATNALVHVGQATSPPMRWVRLRYEEIFGNPIQALHALSGFLELDMTPLIDRILGQRPLDPGHGVGGNRARRQGPLRLGYDEAWQDELPLYARRLAWLAWPLAHRYGYDVFR